MSFRPRWWRGSASMSGWPVPRTTPSSRRQRRRRHALANPPSKGPSSAMKARPERGKRPAAAVCNQCTRGARQAVRYPHRRGYPDKHLEHSPVERQCTRLARDGVGVVAPQTLGRSVAAHIDPLKAVARLIEARGLTFLHVPDKRGTCARPRVLLDTKGELP